MAKPAMQLNYNEKQWLRTLAIQAVEVLIKVNNCELCTSCVHHETYHQWMRMTNCWSSYRSHSGESARYWLYITSIHLRFTRNLDSALRVPLEGSGGLFQDHSMLKRTEKEER